MSAILFFFFAPTGPLLLQSFPSYFFHVLLSPDLLFLLPHQFTPNSPFLPPPPLLCLEVQIWNFFSIAAQAAQARPNPLNRRFLAA